LFYGILVTLIHSKQIATISVFTGKHNYFFRPLQTALNHFRIQP